MSEEQITRAIELKEHGYTCKDIAAFLNVAYQSVTRELRKRGLARPTSVGVGSADEAVKEMREIVKADTPVVKTGLAIRPETMEQLETRTESLAKSILLGAERLIESINNMPDEALQAASLSNKATALGILVDKIKVITNKAQPMFGAGANGQTINIINVIASAASSRRKGSAEIDAEDITPI